MIRLRDALTLAHTKLRTHKIRTGITVGIAGILFGVILSGVIIAQGVFTSIESFSKEGLNDRSILAVGRVNNPFNVYQNLENDQFIAEVEAEHARIVAAKTAAAKKHAIPYNSTAEDPSPISIEEETGKRYIDHSDTSKAAVAVVAARHAKENFKPFDIEGYLAPYPSARILENNSRVQPTNGASFAFMFEGKEKMLREEDDQIPSSQSAEPTLAIMNQSVVDSFVTSSSFDPTRGEIPVIIPFKAAEQLLGLKKLPATATVQDRYDRLKEVRTRIGEVTATFCYRNGPSQQLVGEAESQRKDFEKNGAKKGYTAPALTYKPVSKTDCGPVVVEKDTRTAFEKSLESRYIEYQKEIGVYQGEPVQYKVTVRAVGLSKDAPGGSGASTTFDISGLVEGLLGSWLGYDQWIIPPALLGQVPESARPSELFKLEDNKNVTEYGNASTVSIEEYLVEFDDPNEARTAMKKGMTSNYAAGEISAYPFGSSALIVEEAKEWFAKIVLWALIGVGGIAVIILGSMIGRTVAEGRRESAVFRAIGARRSDVGGIYAMYAVLLSMRVALFALVLGLVIALVVEGFFAEQATLGARFAYASVDTSSEFHFFGIDTWYIPAILGVIIIVGLIAAIIPIILSTRRNPIKDMRDDT
ncbi:MAG: FtsX-like permease family protein [Candidatus Microsaccharimonas sp.]